MAYEKPKHITVVKPPEFGKKPACRQNQYQSQRPEYILLRLRQSSTRFLESR